MDMLLSLLSSLGIDNSVWLQMLVFFVAYAILSNLVFKPMLIAYEHRENKTQGQSAINQASLTKTQEMIELYEQKNRALNKQIQEMYSKVREEAAVEQTQILGKAKSEAELLINNSKSKTQEALKAARDESVKEIPALAHSITEKLVGRQL